MSETRITRAVALMAGNAFLINKLADVAMPKQANGVPSDGVLSWGDVMLAMLGLSGVISAYLSLIFENRSWRAVSLEVISGAAFLFSTYLLLRIGYLGH